MAVVGPYLMMDRNPYRRCTARPLEQLQKQVSVKSAKRPQWIYKKNLRRAVWMLRILLEIGSMSLVEVASVLCLATIGLNVHTCNSCVILSLTFIQYSLGLY